MSPIRKRFRTVTPYLIVEGAAQLMDFTKAAFGAVEKFRVTGPGGRLRHTEAMIGDSMIEMADANPQFGPMPATIHLYVENVDTVYQRALDAVAKSLAALPISRTEIAAAVSSTRSATAGSSPPTSKM